MFIRPTHKTSAIHPLILAVLAAFFIPAQQVSAQSSSGEVEIIKENCPVYHSATRDLGAIRYTVQPGERFPLLDQRNAGSYPLPFYKIRYNSSGDLGWVYGGFVKITERRAGAGDKGGKGTQGGLYRTVSRLFDIYNEEKTDLTSAYSLRPFPALIFGIAEKDSASFQPVDGTLRVPMLSENPDRVSALPTADKFLFQLIIADCFTRSGTTLDRVAIEIMFKDGKSPVRIVCEMSAWKLFGSGGIETFWNHVDCTEPQIWRSN